jgi:hypothetical protein
MWDKKENFVFEGYGVSYEGHVNKMGRMQW